MNRRECALHSFLNILKGQTLEQSMSDFKKSEQDQAWIMALLEGACRYYFAIKTCLQVKLLYKPLPPKDHDIECIFILALYELSYMRSKVYATVNEWVNLADRIKKSSYKGLINALCRRYDREKDSFDFTQYANGPSWLLKKYRKHYPSFFQDLTQAEYSPPPLFLRVNIQKISVSDFYQTLLQAGIACSIEPYLKQCIKLHHPLFVPNLPGYAQGLFYVQDASAQWTAPLLQCKPSQNILDVCAAPGGKALHLLECEPSLHLTATDSSPARLSLLQENFKRFGATARVIQQDMQNPNLPFKPEEFDHILLDAPCSGTGVIRRHPEIKITRNTSNIQALCDIQKSLLQAVWPLLKKAGSLLYVTCSILPEENEDRMIQFLKDQIDAKVLPLTLPLGLAKTVGWQILPHAEGGDGFYYAHLEKGS